MVKFPVRIKCATLSWNALAQGLDEIAAGVPLEQLSGPSRYASPAHLPARSPATGRAGGGSARQRWTLVVDVTLSPQDQEATAATRQAAIEKAKASCSPERNGAAIRLGKKLWPSRTALCDAVSLARACGADEVLDRVVAEEGREQRRDGRQAGGAGGDRRPGPRGRSRPL